LRRNEHNQEEQNRPEEFHLMLHSTSARSS
jgi:hypothetical protein